MGAADRTNGHDENGCDLVLLLLSGRLLHTTLAYPLHRLMQIDYAQSIAVLGRKPG